MTPSVLGDLVGASRRSDATAYRHTDVPARSHTYDSFCPSAWKTANLLRLYGVHAGSTVGIVDAPKDADGETQTTGRHPGTPIPEVLLAFFGAAMLDSTVTFDPAVDDFEGSALLCPVAWAPDVQTSPNCTVLAYGGPPTDPSIVHFEAEVWSETPIEPPETVAPDSQVLATHTGTFTHTELLGAAQSFVEERGLTAADTVGIDAPLTHPGTVVGGVIAPLLVGATIQVGTNDDPELSIGTDVDPEAVSRSAPGERDSRA